MWQEELLNQQMINLRRKVQNFRFSLLPLVKYIYIYTLQRSCFITSDTLRLFIYGFIIVWHSRAQEHILEDQNNYLYRMVCTH
jgi:hypothetical protein